MELTDPMAIGAIAVGGVVSVAWFIAVFVSNGDGREESCATGVFYVETVFRSVLP